MMLMDPISHSELNFKVNAAEKSAPCMGSILELASALIQARRASKPRVLAMGAHAIKLGLSPIIISLIRKRIFDRLLVTSSVLIHDYELSVLGATSQDVDEGLKDGTYGTCGETAEYVMMAAKESHEHRGLGETAGHLIRECDGEDSILAACVESRVPVAVVVALGADTVHWHKGFDPALIADAAYITLLQVPGWVDAMHDGGVWLNAGSAVLLPEVFLKGLMVARHVSHGERPHGFTTAVIDREVLYRPMENVLSRPGGHGIFIRASLEFAWPSLQLMALSIQEGENHV